MEMVLSNEFAEMTQYDEQNVDGGFVIAVVAIGAATYDITIGMVGTAVCGAWALGHVAEEIYDAFF